MRVFLGNSPWRRQGRLGVRAGSRWPNTLKVKRGTRVSHYVTFPFFLAYAASVIREAGEDVLLVDAIAEGISSQSYLKRIEGFAPELVVLETSTPTINTDLSIAKDIRDLMGDTTKIALVGPHVSVMRREILESHPHIDFILIGEYELTLRELVSRLAQNQSLTEVKGIVYRENGNVTENERRAVIMDLDSLPYPAYDMLPMYNYNDSFSVLGIPNVQMWTSRGCPYTCIFCMWPAVMYGNHKYRARNPVKVADELEWLVRTYGFKSLSIDDDTFNLGKERVLTFCDELIARNLGVSWAAMARADAIDEEVMDAMVRAGLIGIKYGVESASQQIVDNCGKKLDLEKAKKAIEISKKAGVKVHLTFTFGLPGETRDTIQKTIDFAVDRQVYSVQFSIATPFPGTPFFNQMKEKGFLLTDNWDDFDGFQSAVIRTESLTSDDLHNALRSAYSTWHSKREQWV